MGRTSRTLVDAVGPFEVVGVQVGLGMGGGGLLRATAHSTLGDGLVVCTLASGVAGNLGRSTLGDGVPVVSGDDAFCWSVGRRILDDRLFRSRDRWCGTAHWIKSPRVCHTIPLGTWHVEIQAPIMF